MVKRAFDLGKWRQRILSAKKFFDERLMESDDLVKIFSGEGHWEGMDADQYSIRAERMTEANLVWGSVDAILPSIYAGVPRVLVKPRFPHQIEKAKSQEKWLNWLLPQVDWLNKRRRAIRTAYLRGYSVMKIVFMGQDSLSQTEPRSGGEEMPPGHPYAIPVQNRDFLCDPDCGLDLSRARWVAFRLRRSKEEFENDPGYKNRDSLPEGAASTSFADFAHDPSFKFDEYPDQQMLEGWEVWVREMSGLSRERFSFIEGMDKAILPPEPWPNPSIEGFPADLLVFHDAEELVEGKFTLPIPETRHWKPLQRALNIILSKSLTSIDRFDRLVIGNKGRFQSPQEAEKAVRGGDGTVIWADNVAGGLDDVMKAITFDALPPEHLAIMDRLLILWQQVTGVGDIQRGQGPASTAATVGALQQQNASLRARDRSLKISQSDKRIMRLMKQVAQDQMDEETLIRVTGPSGFEWLSLSQEDIRAELDIEIDVDSIAPESVEARKARWIQAIQIIGPVLNTPNGVPSGLRELLRRSLHDLGFEDEEVFLPPLAAGIPQEEHNRWMMGQHPQVLPTDDDAAHIAAHESFLVEHEQELRAIPGMYEEIAAHNEVHQRQMGQKRVQGQLSVRGRLRPMAPAGGTPGGMTGAAPMSEASITAPAGMGA